MHHAPFPLLKSVLQEIEHRYKEEVSSTQSHRFRHNDDLPLATAFHAYYCLAAGKAEFSNLKARYIDIGDWLFLGLIHPFSPLSRGKYTFLCLNEVKQIRCGATLRDRVVQNLMRKLFSPK